MASPIFIQPIVPVKSARRRRRGPWLPFALLIIAIAIGSGAVWAYFRYERPTVDMSSIDAMNDSVARIGRLMTTKDRQRLEYLYAKERARFALQIVFLRAGGGTGNYHGMSGQEFLAELEKEWQKSVEKAPKVDAVTIRAEAETEVAKVEAEFDSRARAAKSNEEVDAIREEIKQRVKEIRQAAEAKIRSPAK